MASDVFGIVGTTVVGAFQVQEVVAEGGFGVVYRAYHSGFRAPVALKCLKIPQYLSAEEQARFEAQFQAEAELLFKLSASIQAVVRPLHVEAVVAPDGTFMPFLALEWLEGETLEAVAKRRAERREPPFALGELITLLTPVARALERAHHFEGPEGPISIVHRDMKPENLFIAKVAGERVIKILDFGIAKAKSMASQVAGRTSQRDGESVTSFTPAYGAPEQWLPKRYGQTGPWTDVWGLALTMVELLAGRNIVDGDQAAMMGTVLDPARRPTPRAEGVRVGDAVERVFAKALAVDPRERFRDAGEFWSALVTAHRADTERRPEPSNPPGAVRPASRPPTTSAAPAPSPAVIPDLEPTRPPSRSRPWPSAPASQSGRYPSAPGAPSRGGASPSGARPSVSSAPPASSSVPPPRTSPPPGRPVAEPFEDEDEDVAGPAIELDSRPFAPTEADIPTASAPPSRASTPPPSVSVRAAAPPRTPVAPGPSVAPRRQAPEPSRFSTLEDGSGNLADLAKRFGVPAGMVVAGTVITLVDGAYASAKGEVFTLGPLRLAWLAALLVLGGIGLSLYRLLP